MAKRKPISPSEKTVVEPSGERVTFSSSSPINPVFVHFSLLATLVVYAVVQLLYITATPLQRLTLPDNLPQKGSPEARQVLTGIGPDEKEHFLYILSLAERGRLPVPMPSLRKSPDEYVSYQAQHPPLFYVLGAVVYRVFGGMGESAVWYLLRGLCAVCGALVVVFAAKAARTLCPDRPLLVLATAPFVAFTPMFGHMMGNLSNEPLAMALGAWAWAQMAVLAVAVQNGEKVTVRQALLLGLALGLALCTRLTALLWVIPAFLLLVWALRKKVISLPALVAGVVPVVVLFGGLLALNTVLYGKPVLRTFDRPLLARGTMGEFLGAGIAPAEFPVPVNGFYSLLWYVSTAWTPLWLIQFYLPGGMRAVSNWQRLFLAVDVVALLGLVMYSARVRKGEAAGENAGAVRTMLWGAAGAIGFCVAVVVQQELFSDWNVVLSAGRYFIASVPASGFLFLFALAGLIPRNNRYTTASVVGAGAVAVLMLGFDLYSASLVRRFYSDNPTQASVQTVSETTRSTSP